MAEKENGGVLVPIGPVSDALTATLGDDWKSMLGGPQIYTSIDQLHEEGRLLIYAGITGKCIGSKEYMNRSFGVCNFLMSPVQKINRETGEVEAFLRTVLYLEDGSMVEFFSKGIVKSIMQIQHFCAAAPWNPPIQVKLVDEGKDGRNWHVLKLVDINNANKSVAKSTGKAK